MVRINLKYLVMLGLELILWMLLTQKLNFEISYINDLKTSLGD
jgi:hypothetical protein